MSVIENEEETSFTDRNHSICLILRLHYVPGGHVSDNREQNGITVRQRRGTG